MATAAAVAIVVYSCKSKLDVADKLDLTKTPIQHIDSLYMIQSNMGKV